MDTTRSSPWRALVIVEGVSDQVALEALASRRGRDLEAEGVSIVAIGGAHAMTRFLSRVLDQSPGLELAGLYDLAEEDACRRALERAGFGAGLSRRDMESLGFYVCEADLEDELIRALGLTAFEELVEAEGDGQALRSFLRQPAQRGRGPEAQFRRFIGTRSGRKAQYARALVLALDLARVPRPLDRVLAHVSPTRAGSPRADGRLA